MGIALRRALGQMGISCVNESCTNQRRPQISEAKIFRLIRNFDPPDLLFTIYLNQRRPELATSAAPQMGA
jgi:hypothetical protein